MGGHRPIVWGGELIDENIKYTAALNGRRSMIINATTNQKLAAATKGSMEGRCDKREARGKLNSIVLWPLDVELELKTRNEWLSLVINFFFSAGQSN